MPKFRVRVPIPVTLILDIDADVEVFDAEDLLHYGLEEGVIDDLLNKAYARYEELQWGIMSLFPTDLDHSHLEDDDGVGLTVGEPQWEGTGVTYEVVEDDSSPQLYRPNRPTADWEYCEGWEPKVTTGRIKPGPTIQLPPRIAPRRTMSLSDLVDDPEGKKALKDLCRTMNVQDAVVTLPPRDLLPDEFDPPRGDGPKVDNTPKRDPEQEAWVAAQLEHCNAVEKQLKEYYADLNKAADEALALYRSIRARQDTGAVPIYDVTAPTKKIG